jgi:pimeloyl-ACP methyl ester carboxylesterase
MSVVERTVDVGNLTLAISEAGVGGRPLLLVHGFTGARTDFADHLETLAEAGWHVVAPDNRGHGDSSKPDAEHDYDFDLFAADALALADALGWRTFVLLGHSMGGMVVQHLVLSAPERVTALILMDTHHGQVELDADTVALGVAVARAGDMDTIAQVSAADSPLSTDAHRRMVATRPGYADMGIRNTLRSAPAMYARMATRITDPHDRLDDLSAITCPTLVMVGEQDTPFLDASKSMAATISNAELVVIPDAGHSPQFENPDTWIEAITTFLASID